MARPGGSHAGNVMPEMESTLVQRTTDTSTVGTHDAVLGAPAVQLGGGGSSRRGRGRRVPQLTTPLRPHYRAMDYWESSFPDISTFVKEEVYRSAIRDQIKYTIVRAGVKSGKRLVAQCLAAYTDDNQIINVFLTAYVRKADASQRSQLESYMTGGVFPISSKTKATKCKQAIQELLSQHASAKIIVHYDEFDHGSGINQSVGESGLWGYMKGNSRIHVVLYSASPEEGLIEHDETTTRCLTMPVHAHYRGANYYLQSGLVHEAEPPLKYDKNTNEIIGLGDQLASLLNAAREHVNTTPEETQRNLVIVRVTNGFTELYQKHRTIPGLMFDRNQPVRTECQFVSSTVTANVQWDNYTYWRDEMERVKARREIRVIFIDQMCTRSTDWFCHPFLFAYHDYHGDSALNTVIQSNLRVAYYLHKKNDQGVSVYGGEDHPIQLYGCVEVIEFVAGARALDNVSMPVSSRACVREADTGEYGKPMRFVLPDSVLEDPRITQNVNDQTRAWLKSVLLALPTIRLSEQAIINSRTLATKRTYAEGNTLGGIRTVHGRYVEDRESGPGGGLDTSSEYYLHRENYFWLDIARETTQGIPRGTVYVTYGRADPEEQDEEYEHRLARDREQRPRSIFGH